MDALIEELKGKIISSLKLDDINPNDINADEPLVGDGLGLDSIDTLELIVMLERDYGVTIPDVKEGRKVFSSLRSLAEYVEHNRSKE